MFNITPTVRNLLIINVLVFALMNFGYFPLREWALHDFQSEYFWAPQLFTHMFMHGGIGHLFSNMFSLFIFGPLLERYWGAGRFLTFYLITGLGASLLYAGVNMYEHEQMRQDLVEYVDSPSPEEFNEYLDQHFPGTVPDQWLVNYQRNPNDQGLIQESKRFAVEAYETVLNIPMLGASGAVFGILMAFGMLFPNMELFLIFLPIPIKAKYFVLFYGAYELYAGFQRTPGDNVAHFAHLGGMLFAYILVKYWQRQSHDYS
jgi:membrane associated rhomboid family serine protease